MKCEQKWCWAGLSSLPAGNTYLLGWSPQASSPDTVIVKAHAANRASISLVPGGTATTTAFPRTLHLTRASDVFIGSHHKGVGFVFYCSVTRSLLPRPLRRISFGESAQPSNPLGED